MTISSSNDEVELSAINELHRIAKEYKLDNADISEMDLMIGDYGAAHTLKKVLNQLHIQMVKIDIITIDPEIQLASRGIDRSIVQSYVEALSSGIELKPVVVFDDGHTLWLADGFHRIQAARFLGITEVKAEIKSGTRTDAMIYAATANVTHGRPMSQAQKREAGERLIEMTDLSDREIARRLAVNHSSVTRWKHNLSVANATDTDTPRTVTRNGTTYTMDTTNIGRPVQDISIFEAATNRIEPDRPFDYKRDTKANLKGDIYVPQGYDACQTPPEALDPLLPYIPTWIKTVWEPACGEGYLVEGLYDSSFDVIPSDLIAGKNFFEWKPDQQWDCIITNPPYSIKYKWLERCYELGKPFALLMPVEMLGAIKAQELFFQYGIEVVFPRGRINFKMPNKGWEGGGAQFPTAWFTWGFDIGQGMTFTIQ